MADRGDSDLHEAICREELAIMHHAWCAIAWLMCEWSPDRLTYLRNLEKFHMGTVKMTKEIAKLEKTKEK